MTILGFGEHPLDAGLCRRRDIALLTSRLGALLILPDIDAPVAQVAVKRAFGDMQLLADGADAYPVLEEDLARLSPPIYEHINMLGRYSFAVPEEVARGELRPLRNPDDEL